MLNCYAVGEWNGYYAPGMGSVEDEWQVTRREVLYPAAAG